MYGTIELAKLRMQEIEREIAAGRLARLAELARACCEAASTGLVTRLTRALRPRATNC